MSDRTNACPYAITSTASAPPISKPSARENQATRDGTFLIENGKISRPVNNFRFNQSLVELLNNIEMLGEPTRVAASENSSVSTPVVVPAVKTKVFNLASVSDAI